MPTFDSPKKNNRDNRNMMIQPQLEVGQKDDEYEKEANDMANHVMQMSDDREDKVMKMSDGSEMQPMHDGSHIIHKMHDGTHSAHVMHDDSGKGMTAPTSVEAGINSSKGSGQSLPVSIQREMGNKMGADFSEVKVHTDTNAQEMNKNLNAKAFTHGQDIYFNQDEYNPESQQGKRLLAHELVHTLQQEKGMIKRQATSVQIPLLPIDRLVEDGFTSLGNIFDNLRDGLEIFKDTLLAPSESETEYSVNKVLSNICVKLLEQTASDAAEKIPFGGEIYKIIKVVVEEITAEGDRVTAATRQKQISDFYQLYLTKLGEVRTKVKQTEQESIHIIETAYNKMDKNSQGAKGYYDSVKKWRDRLDQLSETKYETNTTFKFYSAEWIKQFNTGDFPLRGYVDIEINNYNGTWKVTAATIHAPEGDKLAEKLLADSKNSFDLQSFNIPKNIRYFHGNGEVVNERIGIKGIPNGGYNPRSSRKQTYDFFINRIKTQGIPKTAILTGDD